MPHPYDATTKALLETRPADWLPFLGYPSGQSVRLMEADLATVTAAADKVLRVGGRSPWLLHLELQASRDPDLLARLRLYNSLLDHRHRLSVASVVVLLREAADAPDLTGVVERALPGEPPYLEFRYRIVRVWQLPVTTLLDGPPGLLPLAPLADVRVAALSDVVRRMEERLTREITPEQAAVLWSATYVLMGLRYPSALAGELLRGVRAMRESSTWQVIFQEGEARGEARGEIVGMRNLMRVVGTKRFGPPDAAAEAALAAITDPVQLQDLGVRLLEVGSWRELLPPPPKKRRKRTSP